MGTNKSVEKAMKNSDLEVRGGADANLQTLLAAIDSAPGKHSGSKFILFSSTHAGEGKTTVIAELVKYILARQRESVLVIDAAQKADLIKKLLQAPFKAIEIDNFEAAGTIEQIAATTKLAVVRANANSLSADSQLFESETAKVFANRFQYVFVELDSIADAPRAIFGVRQLDGVIAVIEAGRTRWPAIKNACDQLGRAELPIVGAFLNKRTFVIPRKVYEWL